MIAAPIDSVMITSSPPGVNVSLSTYSYAQVDTGAAIRNRLNGFFAISVNSPPLCIVNISCFVRCAPRRSVPFVMSSPQPVCGGLNES
jgi:hypothetical protein